MIIEISDKSLESNVIITLCYNKEKYFLDSKKIELNDLNNLKNVKIIIRDPIYEKKNKLFFTFFIKSFFGIIAFFVLAPELFFIIIILFLSLKKTLKLINCSFFLKK